MTDAHKIAAGRCCGCHHGKRLHEPSFDWWCGLSRLADPDDVVIVKSTYAGAPDYRFTGHSPAWSVSRSVSPGPAEGWSRDWRTGERGPPTWGRCREFLPATRAIIQDRQP